MPYNVYLCHIDSKNIGQFISTNAMVKRVSEIKPSMKIAIFECKNCMKIHKIKQTPDSLKEPAICPDCRGHTFKLLKEESKFTNIQHFHLEEPLELRKDGTTREFNARLEGELVNTKNKINPGDLVHITGILDVLTNEKTKGFNFILKLNNIKPLIRSFEDIKITEEDLKAINEISGSENVFNKFKNSVAPMIYGHDAIKEGLVLQLFSGNVNDNIISGLKRTGIHILFIGDPGIAKSEMLKTISNLSPKGLMINGAASTKAGILGAAVKDEMSGKWAIEAGAMPLSNNGIICIDEMDKMKKGDILSLNEPMEQQTVTETKAGLNVTMAAKTQVLGAANPKYGRIDRYKTIIGQIEIPDSTLSRFDLVYMVEDKIDKEKDMLLAKHILDQNKDETYETINIELMKKYIAYAKREINPKLTDDAVELISNFYGNTREAASLDDSSIPITPRHLQALHRMTLAIARLYLTEYADHNHAKTAIRIYKDSLETIGLKPNTVGLLDGIISKKEKENIEKTEVIIQKYCSQYGSTIHKKDIPNIINEIKKVCEVRAEKAIEYYKIIRNIEIS